MLNFTALPWPQGFEKKKTKQKEFGKSICNPWGQCSRPYGAFTLDVKLVLNENLGGILGGTQC